jgi:hypothetical protein
MLSKRLLHYSKNEREMQAPCKEFLIHFILTINSGELTEN